MAKQGFWSKLFHGEQSEPVTQKTKAGPPAATYPTYPLSAEEKAQIREQSDARRASRETQRSRPTPSRSSTRSASVRATDDSATTNALMWGSLAQSFDSGPSSSCDSSSSSFDSGSSCSSDFGGGGSF